MKKFLFAAALLGITNVHAQSGNAKMNQFVNGLLTKMTLEEKIGQLNLPSVGFDVTGPILSQGVEEKIRKGLVGGVFNTYTPVAVRKLQEIAVNNTRLKIPLLFGYDVVHGHRTIFPIPLGLSASWDTMLIERTARAAAEEMSADGLNWTFSPMVDIARDPRWGRVSEGAGEDPFLGSKIARAMVRGYQGNDLSKDNTVLACVKHFALYGAAEGGRDYNTTDMSRLRMYQDYLPPYKAAIDAGVGSVMTSFNEIEGVPASGNKWLMNDLLRKTWGFKGLIVTDYTAVNEMIAHGMGDAKAVGALTLNATIDMDMVGEILLNEGVSLVKSGKVPMATIDAAVKRILETKYKLGLFDDPYRYVSEDRAKTEIMSADKLALAKEAAVKSSVLLKNNNVLPLSADKKIAFIGPLVKDQRNLIGNWSGAGDPKKAISVWAALETDYGVNKFLYAKGCNLLDDTNLLKKLNPHDAQIVPDPKSPADLIADAVNTAKDADVVVAVLGEAFGMSGEAASRSMIGLPENQVQLLKALKATGKPIVLVLMNGRPLTLSWEDENMDAILETWFPGTQAGPAIAELLFGKANPSGRLSMTFPRNVGQIPLYYNAKNTGRPFDENQKYTSKYLDVPNTPLYPFGYGLSYTRFEYDDIKLDRSSLTATSPITATITVTNTGNYDGEEVVQLYIRDMVGSVTRPVLELKGFQKILLKKGESRAVSFRISLEDVKFFNRDLKWVSEPGEFKLFIGPHSGQLKEVSFKL
ncbi:MAG: beta-glucosidase BglX [Chitinophagaceae bacterium]|nr:MAG: beta-glucosidase BglX [Chitinophagaceae bacterium]